MNLLAVNFHYFGDEHYPRGIYPITPSRFRSQMHELGKKYAFVSQTDMLELFEEQNDQQPHCQITFDDGLKQQMKAFRLLQELNIPAVFYVPTLPIFENKALFVHKLHWIRTLHDDRELLELLKRQGVFELNEEEEVLAAQQYKYDGALARNLKYALNFKLSEDEREAVVHKLFIQAVSNEKTWCEQFYMDEGDLSVLAKAGALGSHGHAHIPLATRANYREDIQRSTEYLKWYFRGAEVISFSYPYGSMAAVDASVAEAVRDNGYTYAYTMWRGINTGPERVHPYLLKRVDTNDALDGKNHTYG